MPLRPERRLQLAALELALIAGAYPAMAVVSGSRRAVALELTAAGLFVGCSLLGLAREWRTPIVAGLLSHGLWDLVHHASDLGKPMPDGYAGFCLIADLLLAIPLAPNAQASVAT